MQNEDYPHLTELMACWFHQDFDLQGDSVAAVMKAYRAVTPVDEQAMVRADITKFLSSTPLEAIEARFEVVFHPDIIPSAFSGSTRAFLQELRDALAP